VCPDNKVSWAKIFATAACKPTILARQKALISFIAHWPECIFLRSLKRWLPVVSDEIQHSTVGLPAGIFEKRAKKYATIQIGK